MGFGLFLIAGAMMLGFTMYHIFPTPSQDASEQLGYQSNNSSLMEQSELLCRRSLSTKALSSGETCTIDSVKRRWAFAAWVFIYSLLGELFIN